LPQKNLTLQHFGQPPLALDALREQATAWGKALGPRIVDTLPMVQEAVRANKQVLLEGQLGVMRDLDWGAYPYVTSSNPLAGAACAGAGLPPAAITAVVGVVKAYCTAVGAGPFPTELKDEVGAQLRQVGQEFGATTGRPRRCGWLDAAALPYAAWLNGFTALAITKLDVLDGLAEIKICTGYRLDGQIIQRVPDTPDYERCEPVYETWPGWQTSTRAARSWRDLPWQAQAYLRRIEALAGAPIRYISVGPEREQLIVI
jgi:adenylosuccinate synthase